MAASRNLTLHFVHLDDAPPKLEALRRLIERGLVTPLISLTLPLTQVAEAHRRQEEGGEAAYGKIVLEVTPQ